MSKKIIIDKLPTPKQSRNVAGNLPELNTNYNFRVVNKNKEEPFSNVSTVENTPVLNKKFDILPKPIGEPDSSMNLHSNSSMVKLKDDKNTKSSDSKTELKKSSKKKFIIIASIIIVLIIFAFLFHKASKALLKFFLNLAEGVEEINEPWRSSIFLACLLSFQITFIPGQSTFIVLMSFVLKNFWHSIALQAISTTTSACLTFLFARRCLKTCLVNKYKDKTLFKVAQKESQIHPWKLNLAFRIMYIPVTFKNVLLSLSGTPFYIYAISLLPAIFFFGSLYTFIGLGLNNISEFYEPGKFNKQSGFGKAKIILGYCVIVFTIVIFVVVCRFTSKKIKNYEAEEAKASMN